MRFSFTKVTISAAVMFAVGCGAFTNQPVPGDDDDDNNSTFTIYEIQDASNANHPGVDTVVKIMDVVVSAVIPDNDRTHFFIQESAGGDFSGIYVFDQQGVTPTELAAGDLVDITGTYTEYNGGSEIVLTPDVNEVNIKSNGQSVTASTIAVADLGTIATGGSHAAALEGVLVRLDGTVQVANPAVSTFGEFTVTNGSDELMVDDLIYTQAEVGRFTGEDLPNLAGILHFSFDEFKIEPRDTNDIPAGSVNPISIFDVQDENATAHPSPGQTVLIQNVVVTALNAAGCAPGFYVADPAGGEYSGIAIFDNAGLAPADLAVGDEVTLQGVYKEYFDKSEIDLVDGMVNRTNTGMSLPAAIQLDANDLASVNAEPYEGVWLELLNPTVVSVMALPDQYDEFPIQDPGGAQLVLDDCLYEQVGDLGEDVGTSYTTLRGILDYSFGAYKLEPRDASDYAIQ